MGPDTGESVAGNPDIAAHFFCVEIPTENVVAADQDGRQLWTRIDRSRQLDIPEFARTRTHRRQIEEATRTQSLSKMPRPTWLVPGQNLIPHPRSDTVTESDHGGTRKRDGRRCAPPNESGFRREISHETSSRSCL